MEELAHNSATNIEEASKSFLLTITSIYEYMKVLESMAITAGISGIDECTESKEGHCDEVLSWLSRVPLKSYPQRLLQQS